MRSLKDRFESDYSNHLWFHFSFLLSVCFLNYPQTEVKLPRILQTYNPTCEVYLASFSAFTAPTWPKVPSGHLDAGLLPLTDRPPAHALLPALQFLALQPEWACEIRSQIMCLLGSKPWNGSISFKAKDNCIQSLTGPYLTWALRPPSPSPSFPTHSAPASSASFPGTKLLPCIFAPGVPLLFAWVIFLRHLFD